MNKLSRLMIVLTLAALVFGGLAFTTRTANAAGHTFNISVFHNINGRALGLDKDLPVVAEVWKDGQVLANLPLSFKDRFTADLEPGTYQIRVLLGGNEIPSMGVGPVEIPAGVDVRIQAQLSGGKTPILSVRVK
jgi:hypothetical protein